MIKTWIAEISPLMDRATYERFYATIPKHRQDKADRIYYKHWIKRAQSVGVWCLWESMKAHFQINDDHIYNFSHSGDYVLCSAETTGKQDVLLGCDIEEVGLYNHSFIHRFYAMSEQRRLRRSKGEGNWKNLFTRYWVLKESYMKATGLGMAIDTRAIEFDIGEEGDMVRLLHAPHHDEDHFYFQEMLLTNTNYKAAVCSSDHEIDPVIYEKHLALD